MSRIILQGPAWNGSWAQGWVPEKGLRKLLGLWSRTERPWVQAGLGGDEYGNPSLYLRCPWAGIVVFYGLRHQEEVELPEPGECAWVDRIFYEDL